MVPSSSSYLGFLVLLTFGSQPIGDSVEHLSEVGIMALSGFGWLNIEQD